MNEEQKQALIEWLKPQIDELQNVSDEIPFGLDSDSAMHLNTMRVALAALTAQPVAWGIKSQLDWLSGHKYLEADLFSQQRFDEVPLFTRAAPASELVPKGWKLVPVEPTESMIVDGFESVPDEDFSEPEVWEAFQMMSGCQQAAYKARLCWAAMIAAAPTPPE